MKPKLTNPHGTCYTDDEGKGTTDNDLQPDWTQPCEVCGQTPIVPFTGMCGPCTFGEADTAGGNW